MNLGGRLPPPCVREAEGEREGEGEGVSGGLQTMATGPAAPPRLHGRRAAGPVANTEKKNLSERGSGRFV